MSPPLAGVRVVDASEGVAGPYCALQLADAGAEVTKLETGDGDRTRQWAPRTASGQSVAYLALNRGKRQVPAGPAGDERAAQLERWAAWADVIVVDGDGPVIRLLPWERAREVNRRLIYCVISGYGPNGPWASRVAGELAAQMASEATASLGRIGEPPVRVGTDMAGMFAGIHAVQAVAAALVAREADGEGDRIDVSLFGSLVTMRSTLWVALSNPDEWWGFHLDSYVKPPFHGFQCRDGRIYFELRGFTAAQREALLDELGMSWASQDARYEKLLADAAGGSGRYTHELMDIWDSGLRGWTCQEAIEIIERHGGVALPMNDYSALLAAEQVKHLNIVQNGHGPDGTEIPYIRSPWHFESAGLGGNG